MILYALFMKQLASELFIYSIIIVIRGKELLPRIQWKNGSFTEGPSIVPLLRDNRQFVLFQIKER